MRQTFLWLLMTGILGASAGCWGESTIERMRRQAQARGDVNKEKEANALALSQGSSQDSSSSSSLPKPVAAVAAPSSPAATAKAPVPSTPISTPSAAIRAATSVEERRARTIENMAKIGRALNVYADGYAGYPPTKLPKSAAYPPMSWRVAILPLLGYEGLFKQYRPNEPWDSTANKSVLAQIPPEFQSPERRDTKTNYLVPLGVEAAFGCGRRLHAGLFEDGPDYTLILIEVDDAHALEWTRPDDLVVQNVPVKPKLGALRGDGFFGVLASGRVCRIKPDADEVALRALFSISGDDNASIRDAIQEATAAPAAAEPAPAPAVAAARGSTGNPPALAPARDSPSPAGVAAQPSSAPGSGATAARDDTLKVAPLLKKLPVPSEADLAKARSAIKELYASDYAEAKTWEARQQFAQKVLDSSREVGEDHAAEYELLRISRELSAQNGDLKLALNALERMGDRFSIDLPALKLETLRLFQKSPAAQTRDKELSSQAAKLVLEATGADNYQVAEEALKVAMGAARRSDEREILAQAAATQKWIEAARKAYDEVPKATARLEASPNDQAANQTVGIYTCLIKGRWEVGLPQLAKAADLKLRFLAKMDLSSSKTPQEMFDLANQYWDLAAEKPDLEERGLKLRAAFWYSLAAKELPAGLDRIRAQKRLGEIRAAYGKEAVEQATATKDLSDPKRAAIIASED